MRNISFAMTAPQFIAGTKDVTRRLGWGSGIQIGDRLCVIKKGRGLKKGEKVERLGLIRVVSVRRERLDKMLTVRSYGDREAVREGFPGFNAEQFVEFFIKGHRGCTVNSTVTRIEFIKEAANG